MTPLYTAIDGWQLEMAKFLLEAGANPNVIADYLFDIGGHKGAVNALHLAVSRRQDNFIRLLADHGANLEMRDKDGLTPLGRAVKQNWSTYRLAMITELV